MSKAALGVTQCRLLPRMVVHWKPRTVLPASRSLSTAFLAKSTMSLCWQSRIRKNPVATTKVDPATRDSEEWTSLVSLLASNKGRAQAADVVNKIAELELDDSTGAAALNRIRSMKDKDERNDQADDGSQEGTQEAETKLATFEASDAEDGGDEIVLSAFGRVVRVARVNVNPFTHNIGSTEVLDIRTRGGDDSVTTDSLAGIPDLQTLVVDLGEGDDVLNASVLDATYALIGRGREGNDIMFGGRRQRRADRR